MADTLSQALLEASVLSSLPEEDEGSIVIDVDRRTMVLPTGFFFGVYNDKDILKVPFIIPRYYNDLDLSEFQISVNYINSAGYGNIYRVNDAEITEDTIRFKWVTGRAVFVKEGTVRFIVCLRQIGTGGEIEKEFNTTIASANVLKGLEVDENPDPVAYSILVHMEELKNQADAAVEIVEGAADRIDDVVSEAEQAIAAMYHSPYVASTAADMLSHDKVYVYTGNETGYTFGNWYYWNGSAFVSGGIYNATAFETDDTLSVSGAAADAKKTGDEVALLKGDLSEIVTGLSDDAKIALLACFEHVAWIDEDGQDYYDALEAALYADEYPRIIATFTPGAHVVYTDDTLSTLKSYLVVKYFEDASDAGTVIPSSDYTLSGILTEGQNVIRVLYDDLATTFTVTAVDFYNVWHWNSQTDSQESVVQIASMVDTGTYDSKTTAAIKTSMPLRCTFLMSRGMSALIYYADGTVSPYYLLPVPENAEKVTLTTTDEYDISTQQRRYNGDPHIFEWIDGSSWAQESQVINIATHETRGRANCIAINVRRHDQGTITSAPVIDILFE